MPKNTKNEEAIITDVISKLAAHEMVFVTKKPGESDTEVKVSDAMQLVEKRFTEKGSFLYSLDSNKDRELTQAEAVSAITQQVAERNYSQAVITANHEASTIDKYKTLAQAEFDKVATKAGAVSSPQIKEVEAWFAADASVDFKILLSEAKALLGEYEKGFKNAAKMDGDKTITYTEVETVMRDVEAAYKFPISKPATELPEKQNQNADISKQ